MEYKKIKRQAGKTIIMAVAVVLLIAGLPAYLQAGSSTIARFSVEIKEWLVLEINSGAENLSDYGNSEAAVSTCIIVGQPVYIKALLSAGNEKTVSLKGSIYPESHARQNETVLYWVGGADLSGAGAVSLQEEVTFAIWKGQGLKNGTLIFWDSGQSGETKYRAVFSISAI
ncbi:MAG: hypothetical protein PHU81_00985 [Acidobacteriota bacterium]|nr:hypothetical protein [Acidobacteriota bacterium]